MRKVLVKKAVPKIDSAYGYQVSPGVVASNQTSGFQHQQQSQHHHTRSPRFLVFPDGTFIMNMFKISFPLPVCKFEGSPCSKNTSIRPLL